MMIEFSATAGPSDTLTSPTPVLPHTVLRAAQSPQALGLWGRRLGGSDLQLFPVALGSGAFGWSVDEPTAGDILDRFVELGGNFIDATGGRADDRSESIVGSWLARPGRRSQVLLGTTIGIRHNLANEPARAIVQKAEDALGRLAVDHLDLLSIRLDGAASTGEGLAAATELVRAGKVRYAAVDDPATDQLIEARVITGQSGAAPLVAAQGNYSLLYRDAFEAEVAGVVTMQGCGFMPRQPLAFGLLAGREHSKPAVARLRRRGLVTSLPPRHWPSLVGFLHELAAELGVTAPAVALAWLLNQPAVTAPIVSVSSQGQLEEAMAAVRLQLTRQQVADLDRLSAG